MGILGVVIFAILTVLSGLWYGDWFKALQPSNKILGLEISLGTKIFIHNLKFVMNYNCMSHKV